MTRWLPTLLFCAVGACADDRPLPTEADASLVVRRWMKEEPSEACAEGALTVRPDRVVLQQAFWLDGAVQVVGVMTGERHGACPGAGPFANAVHARVVPAGVDWVLEQPPTFTELPLSVIAELEAEDDLATRRQLGALCRRLDETGPLDVAGLRSAAAPVARERVDLLSSLGQVRPDEKVAFLQAEAARVGGVEPSCAAAFSRFAPVTGGQGE